MIIVKVKGRDNTFRDVTVRKHKVLNALVWLVNNNPHYKDIAVNENALQSLPENGVPPDLLSVETEDDIVLEDDAPVAAGPPTDNPSEDVVCNNSTEMSSFLSVSEPMAWSSIENEPLNEHQVSHLATMAFPTLFPDGKGDPSNEGLLRDVPFQERIKHLLKFANLPLSMANGFTGLPIIPDFHIGLLT